MKKFSWDNVCPPGGADDDCTFKKTMFAESMVCGVVVILAFTKLAWKKFGPYRKPETDISKLIDNMVLVLFTYFFFGTIAGLLLPVDYYTISMLHAFDANGENPAYINNMVVYGITTQIIETCVFLWHTTIAVTMYRWIVLKRSANSMRMLKCWVPSQFLLATVLCGIRGAMFLIGGKYPKTNLRMWTFLVHDAFIVPTLLTILLWHYLRTMDYVHKASSGGAGLSAKIEVSAWSGALLVTGMFCGIGTRGLAKDLGLFQKGKKDGRARGPRSRTALESASGSGASVSTSLRRGRSRDQSGSGASVDSVDVHVVQGPDLSHRQMHRDMDEEEAETGDIHGDLHALTMPSVAEQGPSGRNEDDYDSDYDDDDDYDEDEEDDDARHAEEGRATRPPPTHEAQVSALSAASSNKDLADPTTNKEWKYGKSSYMSTINKDKESAAGAIGKNSYRRNMPIVRRLTYLCSFVAGEWIVFSFVRTLSHTDHGKLHPVFPLWLHYVAVCVNALVVVCDGIILAGIFSGWGCCDSKQASKADGRKSEMSSVVAPARHASVAMPANRRERADSDSEGEYKDVDDAAESKTGASRWPSIASVGGGSNKSIMSAPSLSGLFGKHGSASHLGSNVSEPEGGPLSLSHNRSEVSALQRVTRAEAARVLCTTWNMGGVMANKLEAELPAALHKWLPQNYDLYVIGVQESQCLKELKAIVHEHLGGPSAYSLFSREIGLSGIHGYISLLVLARAKDVASGAFAIQQSSREKVASGVKLGGIQLPNKGMTGFSARLHDTTLALVTAHFAADLKGRNRIERRNQDAKTVLQQLTLLWDSEFFDVHTQHHHAVVLGDLNYRVQGHPDDVLQLVSASAQSMKDTLPSQGGDTNWRDQALEKLVVQQNKPPKRHTLTRTASFLAETCWSWVPEKDELSGAMAKSTVFCGFQEGAIAFPPSYRWQRGTSGGDFTDPAQLKATAYCTDVSATPGAPATVQAGGSGVAADDDDDEGKQADGGEEEAGGAAAGPAGQKPVKKSKLRTPSYTDRVLTHSLPGQANRLAWKHYDLVDAVTLSDHRPVVAILEITVDRAVCGFKDESWGGKLKKAEPEPEDHPSLSVWQIRDLSKFSIYMASPRFYFSPASDEFAGNIGAPVPVSVTVLFPLLSEDPLAFARKSQSLLQALSGIGGDAPRGSSLRRKSTGGNSEVEGADGAAHGILEDPGSAVRTVKWSHFPTRHRAIASTRFSEHMLIKVAGPDGMRLGQGAVVLKDFIGREARRARIELCAGGVLMGSLSIDLKVKLTSI